MTISSLFLEELLIENSGDSVDCNIKENEMQNQGILLQSSVESGVGIDESQDVKNARRSSYYRPKRIELVSTRITHIDPSLFSGKFSKIDSKAEYRLERILNMKSLCSNLRITTRYVQFNAKI